MVSKRKVTDNLLKAADFLGFQMNDRIICSCLSFSSSLKLFSLSYYASWLILVKSRKIFIRILAWF